MNCRSPYLEVGRLRQDPRVVLRARSQWAARASSTRAGTEPELGAVVLADPHSCGEAERRRQPGDGLADVGVDQWGKTVAAGMQRLALYRPMQPVS